MLPDGVSAHVRRLSVLHLQGHDAQGPDVNLVCTFICIFIFVFVYLCFGFYLYLYLYFCLYLFYVHSQSCDTQSSTLVSYACWFTIWGGR